MTTIAGHAARARRQAPRWPVGFLILYALCVPPTIVLILGASLPSPGDLFRWVAAMVALTLLTASWVVLCLVHLVVYRRATWWMAVAPVLGLVVWLGNASGWPLQARFLASESAMTQAAKEYRTGGAQPHLDVDRRLGLYRFGGVDVETGGDVVLALTSNDGGFIYAPGTPALEGDQRFSGSFVTHLHGPWWSWSTSTKD